MAELLSRPPAVRTGQDRQPTADSEGTAGLHRPHEFEGEPWSSTIGHRTGCCSRRCTNCSPRCGRPRSRCPAGTGRSGTGGARRGSSTPTCGCCPSAVLTVDGARTGASWRPGRCAGRATVWVRGGCARFAGDRRSGPDHPRRTGSARVGAGAVAESVTESIALASDRRTSRSRSSVRCEVGPRAGRGGERLGVRRPPVKAVVDVTGATCGGRQPDDPRRRRGTATAAVSVVAPPEVAVDRRGVLLRWEVVVAAHAGGVFRLGRGPPPTPARIHVAGIGGAGPSSIADRGAAGQVAGERATRLWSIGRRSGPMTRRLERISLNRGSMISRRCGWRPSTDPGVGIPRGRLARGISRCSAGTASGRQGCCFR